jgi:polysaccharide pyruvyl transferase WcaK-like protein
MMGLIRGSARMERTDNMNNDKKKVRSVGLWGHNGTGNMGNEATVSAIIQNLRKRLPDISLYGYAWNPQDTRKRHGIISFPINRKSSDNETSTPPADSTGLWITEWKTRLKKYPMAYNGLKWLLTPLLELLFSIQACRSINGIDLMLVVGTGLIADTFGGYANYPYSLFRWSLYCRIKGVKWAVVSVGAGPVNGYLSKKFIKAGLAHCAYRSFRDDYSKRLVEYLGVKGDNRVYPDLVFGLDISDYELSPLQDNTRIVAFNALPFRKPGAWENPSDSFYQSYCDMLIRFVSWLLEEGYTVHFVPTQFPMDIEFLEYMSSNIVTNVPEKLHIRSASSPTGSVKEIISQFSAASMVVTTRFHGIIFPYLLGKPVLALSYHPKMTELMKDFGQERYCIDIESLKFDMLKERFKDLASMRQDISIQIRDKVEQNKTMLDKQYLELLQI